MTIECRTKFTICLAARQTHAQYDLASQLAPCPERHALVEDTGQEEDVALKPSSTPQGRHSGGFKAATNSTSDCEEVLTGALTAVFDA